MIKEFKEFISRGNVMDLAVGVIMGAAFTAIVQSLVSNLINPLIGLFLGKIDLSNLVFKVGDATFKYGTFIESIINFLIIAFVVFLLVKVMNKIIKSRDEEEAEPEEDKQEEMVMYLKKISEALDEKKDN
ncbi:MULTISPECIES: large-conductance mechanosensitive channel protein MscL [Companilactobacillus]|jgi:large conductance mechanosensitive channel|uniref:Large-conductance mechanosensitive channel n=1 Tax=Companilactobacillus pabuli TaxID=2714036 RepID=A0A7L7KXC0_9LACO|nr:MULTISPECIES: large-conductance mechanosensitive channel protein MscL [Companilactobacillus]AKP03532.1 mechanosensitive ion channel protein MscL [Companilactobacillus farciminis]AKS51837.1 mechanosensitive ion channel protein MscL [Companilactobacillus farciminis]MDG5112731.1 large-conductance mechanosensitive channel protein MscL [Companilactobacillus pabuli]QMT84433.1 large-conductance mechanosensitive channel protein MscL [Companilactobacillus pabuli]GAQ00424.1 large conductance mechanos